VAKARKVKLPVLEEEDLRIEAIRGWMALPVTRSVWKVLQEALNDNHEKLHAALQKRNYEEAANCEAGRVAILEAINVPENMITDLKIEKESARETNP
jgi:hypothetical protein